MYNSPPHISTSMSLHGTEELQSQYRSSPTSETPSRKQRQDMVVELEKEFYTASFVASMNLGQERLAYERNFGECFFGFAMLVVASVQCMTVFGMSAYLVEKEAGYRGESKLATGLFVNGGATMPLGYAEDLCGALSALPLQHFAGRTSLELPDGTKYSGNGDMPMFHTYKMPSGSWDFSSIGGHQSYLDMLLRVLRDAKQSTWHDTFAEFRVEYGYLFVAMVALLWFYVLFELRKIARFMFLVIYLYGQGIVSDFKQTTEVDKEGKITIKHMNRKALIAGILCILARTTVSTMMLVWGTSLLAATGNKLNLVLNAIAIGIVFELDVVVAYAVIDHNTISRIESIEPVKCTGFHKRTNKWDIAFGLFLFLGVFCGAGLVRKWQMTKQTQSLQSAAALCLFAGPTPQARPDLVAPVTGFCESLLSLSCAPSVEGPNNHGPCVVTNQDIFKSQTIVYPAEGQLFEGMYDANGERRSMAYWGSPKSELVRGNAAWLNDVNLNAFRKTCVQLYQPRGDVDMRVVEPSTGVKTYSAPFFCSREHLFEAVFGGASDNFEVWSSTLDLRAPRIVAALDKCQEAPPPLIPEAAIGRPLTEDEADDGAVNDSRETNVLPKAPLAAIVKHPAKHYLRHRVHHEVRHYKIEAPTRD